jgi:hypothetical protein
MPLTFDAKYMAFRLFSSVLNPTSAAGDSPALSNSTFR